jgi:hypothetical protein
MARQRDQYDTESGQFGDIIDNTEVGYAAARALIMKLPEPAIARLVSLVIPV